MTRNKNNKQFENRLPTSVFGTSDRILTVEQGDQFNNARNVGDEISKDASKNVGRNLDEMDRRIEEAKKIEFPGYGIRTSDNAKVEYDVSHTQKILRKLKELGVDYYVPNFPEARKLGRSPLHEVPLVRFSPANNKAYNDKNRKVLYVENDKQFLQVGKDMPYSQPVITHEFLFDSLKSIAEEHSDEYEIALDKIYDDRRGYRINITMFSPRFDKEVPDSYRIGDVIRIGAMVRNGIDEGMGVGIDAFTFAVKCANGSIGRGKDLGSQSWVHKGLEDTLKEHVLDGLEQMIDISEELANYQIASNRIKMRHTDIQQIYENILLADRYYDDKYFLLNPEEKKTEDRIKLQKGLDGNITLWEGYNALTAPIWHSENLGFGGKSNTLRQLNNQLVAIVKRENVRV